MMLNVFWKLLIILPNFKDPATPVNVEQNYSNFISEAYTTSGTTFEGESWLYLKKYFYHIPKDHPNILGVI